ncbi:YvrJ family protein [Oceanobacillus arenosus]|uniref:YvrJ family protein n=1 Tax=Oceanobacillus arenosus TaxID=1229153 RepID=A0A3D8Q1F9_9BACI|nr:YvrJ family protein [Oceanobacillus arenosus]RDW21401.1 YvrJ family protein [Oceanobacillus arenosus]
MNEISVLSDVIQLMENVGFPVVVTLILLIRYEFRMERLEKLSKKLSDTINELRRDIS